MVPSEQTTFDPPVFRNGPRSDGRRRGQTEPIFTFLDRRAGPHWDQVRQTIESWVGELPNHALPEIMGPLRSTRNAQHQAAVWEAGLHHLLRAWLGDAVLAKPTTHGPPDFEIVLGDARVAVEATLNTVNPAVLATPPERAVFAAIENRVRSRDFTLSIYIDEAGSGGPPIRRVIDDAQALVDELDWAEERDLVEQGGSMRCPGVVVRRDGWVIELQAIAVAPDRRGPRNRVLGAMSGGDAVLVDDQRLRRSLRRKAHDLNQISDHGVIAIAWDPFFPDPDPIPQVLFGAALRPPSEQPSQGRDGWGLWHGPDGQRNTRIEAVLVVSHFHLWMRGELDATAWRNPWFIGAPCFDPPWARLVCADQVLRDQPIWPATRALGLPEDWPTTSPWGSRTS